MLAVPHHLWFHRVNSHPRPTSSNIIAAGRCGFCINNRVDSSAAVLRRGVRQTVRNVPRRVGLAPRTTFRRKGIMPRSSPVSLTRTHTVADVVTECEPVGHHVPGQQRRVLHFEGVEHALLDQLFEGQSADLGHRRPARTNWSCCRRKKTSPTGNSCRSSFSRERPRASSPQPRREARVAGESAGVGEDATHRDCARGCFVGEGQFGDVLDQRVSRPSRPSSSTSAIAAVAVNLVWFDHEHRLVGDRELVSTLSMPPVTTMSLSP